MGPIGLNQRVQGSSPCAPTNLTLDQTAGRGGPLLTTRDPHRLEVELAQQCHLGFAKAWTSASCLEPSGVLLPVPSSPGSLANLLPVPGIEEGIPWFGALPRLSLLHEPNPTQCVACPPRHAVVQSRSATASTPSAL